MKESRLDVLEQSHEPEIHMQLLMTVKQRKPRIVGDEIDFHFLIAAKHHYILHHAGSWLPGYSSQFETVAMKVDWMDVIACIPHAQPVSLAFPYAKHGLHAIF